MKNGFVTLRELKKQQLTYEAFAGTSGSGTEIPTEEFIEDEKSFRKKIKYTESDNTPYVQLSTYEYVYVWDGQPEQFDYRNI